MHIGTTQVNGPFWLNADGTLDLATTPPLFQTEAYPADSAPLSGGRLMVWGGFDKIGATTQRGLVRVNPDGTLDPTFNFAAPEDLVSVGPAGPLADNSLYAFLRHGNDPGHNPFRDLDWDSDFSPVVEDPDPISIL